MGIESEFLSANAEFAKKFSSGDLQIPPARQVAVVTCMDARLHPEAFLGLNIGDAHMIRNAGGRVSDDALRSLVLSQRLLGTKSVFVILHTNCGVTMVKNTDILAKVKADLGVDITPYADNDYLLVENQEQAIKDDVAAIKNHPFLNKDTPVYGYIYHVENGTLTKVTEAISSTSPEQ